MNETVFVDGRCVPCTGNQVYSRDLDKCVCKKNVCDDGDRERKRETERLSSFVICGRLVVTFEEN